MKEVDENNMKRKPEIAIENIKLIYPECGEELKTDICQNCGCEIDTREITIDIQPEEILGK